MNTSLSLYRSLAALWLSLVVSLGTHHAYADSDKEFMLSVLFTDSKTALPLSEVEVTITNLRTNNTTTTLTGAAGSLTLMLRDEAVFAITGRKADYFFSGTHTVSTIGRASSSRIEVALAMRQIIIGERYAMPEVEFKVNSAELTNASENVLTELAQMMREHPSLQIEVGCHTDARGDDSYNLHLSQQRAETIVKYLSDLGIASARLSPKGYGETVLLNQCGNGVQCSSSAHLQNRRVEFQILSAHF